MRSTLPRATLRARKAAQLEDGGGREKPPPSLVEQQVEVVALDKDRVVVETAMRLDVAVAGLVGDQKGWPGCPRALQPMCRRRAFSSVLPKA